MNDNIALRVLADDSTVIAYRPALAVFLGSVTAAILLQQILYRFTGSNHEPFYKFREPCSNELYKEGDSWCEELGYSVKQFDTALSVIGTKITKGVNKTDAMTYEVPDGVSLKEAIVYLVIYWTDSSRITWYWLNWDLLGKCLNGIYLDKPQKGRYLVNTEKAYTFSSENKTEKTKEDTRKSRKSSNGKKQPIERDEIYNAIGDVWNVFGDTKIVSIREVLINIMGTIDPTEIRAFGAYMAKQEWLSADKSNMPASETSLPTWVGRFRAIKPATPITYTNGNLQAIARSNGLIGEIIE